MTRAKGFQCPKTGHRPMKGVPEEVVLFDSLPHVGRVCAYCKGVYYEQLGNKKIERSKVIMADGSSMPMEVKKDS